MSYKIILTIIFLFSSLFKAQEKFNQTDKKSIIVDSIRVVGNDITEDYIILRELNFFIGDTVSLTQIEFNQERVFSLGLFNKVELNIIQETELSIIEISVFESWYIYPLPFLKLRDDRISRASYGLILLYKNFRGRNETLSGLATFGYDPSYSMSYFNPMLIDGENITFGFGLGYIDVQNRNLKSLNLYGNNFDYDFIYSTISVGYRINLFNTISFSPSFQYVSFPSKVSDVSASNTSIDRTYSLNVNYEFDNRNLKQFSDAGIYSQVSYSKKGFGINNIKYSIMYAEFRGYQKIYKNLSAKMRGKFRHSYGNRIPFYDLSLLGDIDFVRGHKFNKREGNNSVLTSLEMNYPIIKEWDLSLDLPLLPKRLTSARIGLYTNLFVDGGTTYNNGEALTLRSFDSGWGFGFTLLILPYNAIRFEYAFDEIGKGEFLIESGFSF